MSDTYAKAFELHGLKHLIRLAWWNSDKTAKSIMGEEGFKVNNPEQQIGFQRGGTSDLMTFPAE